MGRRTSQVESVGWDFFLYIFLFLVAKNYPKNIEFQKKSDFVLQKIFGKIFNIFQKKFQILVRKWLILQDFGKLKKKKKLPKRKKTVGRARKTGFLFFLALPQKWNACNKAMKKCFMFEYKFSLKLESYFINNAGFSHHSLVCALFVLKVMSVYRIDQYQNTIPGAMPLHQLKKSSTSIKHFKIMTQDSIGCL